MCGVLRWLVGLVVVQLLVVLVLCGVVASWSVVMELVLKPVVLVVRGRLLRHFRIANMTVDSSAGQDRPGTGRQELNERMILILWVNMMQKRCKWVNR